MSSEIDYVELASEIAEIARTTTDPDTGGKLVKLAGRLLCEAGVPDHEHGGGGALPGGWPSETAAFAEHA
jgi:hypothetical protein